MQLVIRIACCVLLLAACRFPGTVHPTIKIGLVAPFEGRYRDVGYDVIYAVRLALRQANAAGGVGGGSSSADPRYNVELVAYDDGGDPAMAVEQARKLAVDPTVVAVIGHFGQDTTATALDVYTEADIPLVAPPGFELVLTGGLQVYHLAPPAGVVADALLQYIIGLGRDRAALVTEGGLLGVALQQDGQPSHQIRVWPIVSPVDSDWLETIVASDTEVVLCDARPVMAGEVLLALRDAGWEGMFLGGPALAAGDFAAVAGQAVAGTTFVTPCPFPADVPGSADFVAAYRAVSNDVSPGPLALPAYEATWVLLEALERDVATEGLPTRDGMASALLATERGGLLGPIIFDAAQRWDRAPLYWYRIGVGGVMQRLP